MIASKQRDGFARRRSARREHEPRTPADPEIGTRMIAGRDITWTDMYFHTTIAIVSENLAREVWGSPVAALGQHIKESAGTTVWREIVGVVEDVHEDTLYQPHRRWSTGRS
jgi:hypothetical protein